MSTATMKHGDFTTLAANYALYRPGYSPMVLDAFLAIGGPAARRCADVGAGTGIFSRQLARKGIEVTAVEPNDAMRQAGEKQNDGLSVLWQKGSAEETGLADNSFPLACMASSFHWPVFDKAVREFDRILSPNGLFMALWNTRHYESNPLLVDIENYLHSLAPHMKRVSSGRSEFCNGLLERLKARPEFTDVIYVEGRHTELQSPERYLGLWHSVNDIQVQLGEDNFAKFMQYIENVTRGVATIEAEYTTRAWIARRKG